MTRHDDAAPEEYAKIQYTGNGEEVGRFAGACAAIYGPSAVKLHFEDRDPIIVGYGDYLFKDRDGKLVASNPA